MLFLTKSGNYPEKNQLGTIYFRWVPIKPNAPGIIPYYLLGPETVVGTCLPRSVTSSNVEHDVILRNVGGLLGDVSWHVQTPFLFLESPWGGVGQFVLGESQSRIYPNMCAKFGCGPTVASKKGGYRQTDRQTKGHCVFM